MDRFFDALGGPIFLLFNGMVQNRKPCGVDSTGIRITSRIVAMPGGPGIYFGFEFGQR